MSDTEFTIIPGQNNIILVAPHGYMGKPRDDEQTALIALKMQKMLNCYAVINDVYRKPREGDRAPFNKEEKICNLNNISEYKEKDPALYEAFVGPIKLFKDEITNRGQIPYIFHIHGASTADFDIACKKEDAIGYKNINILIGTGRGASANNKGESLTALPKDLDSLITCLKEEQLIAYSTNHGEYAAKKAFNLNQLFREPNYPDKEVLSFQLEIRKQGLRDKPDTAVITARRLAAAIGKFTGVTFEEEEATHIMKNEIVAAEFAPEIIEAADKIIEIFQNNLASGLIEVGEMLLKEFFNDDFSSVRNREKLKDEPSILQIHRELESRGVKTVSKSWLYNAINVAADSKYIESRKEFFDFHTYGNLPASHKVLLERVRDDAQKQAFIAEAGAKNLSFVELKNTISEKKELPAPTPQINVLKAASNPEKLFSGDYDSRLNLNALKAMRSSSRKKLKEKITEAIEKQEQYLKKYRELVEYLNELAEDVEQNKINAK